MIGDSPVHAKNFGTPMDAPSDCADTPDRDDGDQVVDSGSYEETTATEDVDIVAPSAIPPDGPPRLLSVDATWIALAWAPSMWAVVSDVPLGQRYRVLVAAVQSDLDTRMHDLHAYHCCYEGIGTSTQVRCIIQRRRS